MANKPCKTGLGVDVFFPKDPASVAIPEATSTGSSAETAKEVEKKKQIRTAKSLGSRRPGPIQNLKKQNEESNSPVKPEADTIKLTVMVDATKYDQLEELKRQERQRLRREGGEKGHNWRRRITTTQLIDEALAEFLTRKGYKGRKP